MGVSEQRPNGIFPPVDVVQACYLVGYMLYYLSHLPWRFLYLYHGISLHGPRWGPHQALNGISSNNIWYLDD